MDKVLNILKGVLLEKKVLKKRDAHLLGVLPITYQEIKMAKIIRLKSKSGKDNTAETCIKNLLFWVLLAGFLFNKHNLKDLGH